MKNKFLQNSLNDLAQKGLKRELKNLDGPQNARIKLNGKEVLNFCSNNYLGLADDNRLCQAAIESIKNEGLGSGASRLVCGNMNAHRQLERKIAAFKGTESCLVFNSGYTANVGIISGLFDRGDIIFSDRLNHASIVDGIILSTAAFKRYPHKDMRALEDFLKNAGGFKERVIITETVFSMDGDIAPLNEIARLAERYDTWLMVDEAHAFGVLGEKGKGAVEYFNLDGRIDIQMGTLSKAVGSFGAYCCGSNELIEFLINKARSFIYTTSLPPAIAAASLEAIEIIENEPQRREKLWENTEYLKKGLDGLGFDTLDSQTPIIPILVKDSKLAVEFSRRLFEEGIFVQAIRPPTVPVNTSRLRVTVMATHARSDLDLAVEKFRKAGRELSLI